jgi:hypothetical protein
VTDFVVGTVVRMRRYVPGCHSLEVLGEMNLPHSALLKVFRNPGYSG